jgi:signal transduction histidine kinase
MNIRTKLTIRFTAIVATILLVFSVAVYYASAEYRREEFYERLESRGLTTARLLVTVQEVDNNLLRIIDRNTIHAMFQEKIVVFAPDDALMYSSLDDLPLDCPPELIRQIREQGVIRESKAGVERVGFVFQREEGNYVVLSSAIDRYGRSKLVNLRNVLLIGFTIGILAIVLAGAVFSQIVLRPVAALNQEISEINAGNLNKRVDEGQRSDEVAQLAINFNLMLQRLESSFEMQQQFVSSASHELRTPLAAISSQLQLVLEKKRDADEYERTLHSVLDDTQTLIELTNGLLTLAQSDIEQRKLQLMPVRVDEVLFAAQNELAKTHPGYHFLFEYETLPEEEAQLNVLGNEYLLRTAFLNLMDNACKFSADHTVRIQFGVDPAFIHVVFRDKGIGIAQEDLPRIFTPFYRTAEAQVYAKGYGIGLSLCQRIVQLHRGHLLVNSVSGSGTVFEVQLPAFPKN